MTHQTIKGEKRQVGASKVGIYCVRKLQIDANFRPTSRKIIKLKSRSVATNIQKLLKCYLSEPSKLRPAALTSSVTKFVLGVPRSHPTIPKSRTKRFSIIVGSLRRTQSPSIFMALRNVPIDASKGKHPKDRSFAQLTFIPVFNCDHLTKLTFTQILSINCLMKVKTVFVTLTVIISFSEHTVFSEQNSTRAMHANKTYVVWYSN